MSQVHPDLVGAPRFQRQLQEAMLPALLQHLKMGNSLLATCHHLTAVGLQGIPAYRQIDGTLREFCLQQSHITRDNCLILAVQTACCQGSFQLCLHLRAFGEQHAAGSIPVQAVQRPDCHHLPLDLEIMCQIIGKGAGAGLPGRMHQHPGRLVQHNHLIVLVENLHCTFLRHYSIAGILELADCHHIASLQQPFRMGAAAVHIHTPAEKQLLPLPCRYRHNLLQILLQLHSIITSCHNVFFQAGILFPALSFHKYLRKTFNRIIIA